MDSQVRRYTDARQTLSILNDPPRFQNDVRQAFQPDSKPDEVRLESLTYLIFWRVVVYFPFPRFLFPILSSFGIAQK
jgi:hypothetical protein